jgi:hypothetical protein
LYRFATSRLRGFASKMCMFRATAPLLTPSAPQDIDS